MPRRYRFERAGLFLGFPVPVILHRALIRRPKRLPLHYLDCRQAVQRAPALWASCYRLWLHVMVEPVRLSGGVMLPPSDLAPLPSRIVSAASRGRFIDLDTPKASGSLVSRSVASTSKSGGRRKCDRHLLSPCRSCHRNVRSCSSFVPFALAGRTATALEHDPEPQVGEAKSCRLFEQDHAGTA
jgi:hypothetical protein